MIIMLPNLIFLIAGLLFALETMDCRFFEC